MGHLNIQRLVHECSLPSQDRGVGQLIAHIDPNGLTRSQVLQDFLDSFIIILLIIIIVVDVDSAI